MGRRRYALLAREPQRTYWYKVEVVGSAVRLTWEYRGQTEQRITEYCTPDEAVVWAQDKIYSKRGEYSVVQGDLEPRRALIPVEELLAPSFAQGHVLVYFDTETTGLGVRDRLVQWGMLAEAPGEGEGEAKKGAGGVEGIRGKPVREYMSYIRPEVPIHPAATAIHGITAATVENAPTFPEAWAQICQTIREWFPNNQHTGPWYLVAYNAAFDRNMLVSAFEAHGLAGEVEKVYRGQYRFVDAMPQQQFPWPKLVDLYRRLVGGAHPPAAGLDTAGRHDALGDARMMKAVLDAQVSGTSS